MAEDNTPVFFTSLEELKEGLENDPKGREHFLKVPGQSLNEQEEWFSEDFEGQLSVDVFQTEDKIIVKSTIAGVKPEDLEIYIHDDLLTIRGRREGEFGESQGDYLYKECYWGGFSRSIILPTDVQVDKVQANLKNGVLTIILPKAAKAKLIPVQFGEE